MEGGDLFGAYERACQLAELKARLAGVVNPVSALHGRQASSVVATTRLSEGRSSMAGLN
jgi:hypothetical protein